MSATAEKIPQVSLLDHCRYLKAVLKCKTLTKTAMRLAGLIADGYRADWGYCSYTVEQMAEWLDTTIQSIHTAIKELEKQLFMHIDRRYNRNRYTPLFGEQDHIITVKPERESSSRPSRKLYPNTLKKTLPHSIEEVSGSYKNQTLPKERIEKPIACGAKRSRSQAAGIFSLETGGSWRSFEGHVLGRYSIPAGWDRWAFEKSVHDFIKKMRQENPWEGLRLATKRLAGWFRTERYKTRLAFESREFDDWIETVY